MARQLFYFTDYITHNIPIFVQTVLPLQSTFVTNETKISFRSSAFNVAYNFTIKIEIKWFDFYTQMILLKTDWKCNKTENNFFVSSLVGCWIDSSSSCARNDQTKSKFIQFIWLKKRKTFFFFFFHSFPLIRFKIKWKDITHRRRCLMDYSQTRLVTFCVCWLHFDLLLVSSPPPPPPSPSSCVYFTFYFFFFSTVCLCVSVFSVHFFLSHRFYSWTKHSVEHSIVFYENRFQVVPMPFFFFFFSLPLYRYYYFIYFSHLSELKVVVFNCGTDLRHASSLGTLLFDMGLLWSTKCLYAFMVRRT